MHAMLLVVFQVHMEFFCNAMYVMGHNDAAQRQPSAACQLASDASTAMCHTLVVGTLCSGCLPHSKVCLGAIRSFHQF